MAIFDIHVRDFWGVSKSTVHNLEHSCSVAAVSLAPPKMGGSWKTKIRQGRLLQQDRGSLGEDVRKSSEMAKWICWFPFFSKPKESSQKGDATAIKWFLDGIQISKLNEILRLWSSSFSFHQEHIHIFASYKRSGLWQKHPWQTSSNNSGKMTVIQKKKGTHFLRSSTVLQFQFQNMSLVEPVWGPENWWKVIRTDL